VGAATFREPFPGLMATDMSSGKAPENLFLLDAHSLIFQVFHALPEMSSPSGLPTNAVFGFTKDLLYIRMEKKPDYLVCVFDAPGRTFRDDIFPEYKAHRGPMPDDLQLQIPLIQQLLDAMCIPVLAVEGYEADDVIATVAAAGAKRGLDVFICSSDKDCRQLIGDHVKIFNLRKRQVFDREALQQDWGIKPEQVIDLQTLVGDSVDNVPGVPGIGLKTAAKLLQDFGTLDNVLAHIDEIPGAKRQENLKAATATMETSRRLVRLATDVPVRLDWENWRVCDWDEPKLLELLRSWGFHTFPEQIRAYSRSRPRKDKKPVQGYLFDESDDGNGQIEVPPRRADDNWQATYHLVNTPEKFAAFLAKLREQLRIALDLETTHLEPRRAEIVGLAFCWQAGEAWYLPLRGPEGESVLEPATTLNRLRPILECASPVKINQNIKYDLQVLRQNGVHLAGVVGDPMVADYLLHAGERSHGLDTLADKHLNHIVIPVTDLIGKGKGQLAMDRVPLEKVAEYAGEDADAAWRLCAKLEPVLEKEHIKRPQDQAADAGKVYLYDDLEVPLIEVLADLEFTGVRLNVPFLRQMSEEMGRQLSDLEKAIHEVAGHEFNINSLKQLRQVMFDELQLPRKRKTAITGEASTDQETLDWLAREGYELPKKLVEHRRIAKLKGTYVDALPELVNPATGRIHASFNQTIAATGRLSSSDPNLQNIPIRTEEGGQIRKAFLPEEGWSILAADYSQIELRLLAHFSGDENLRRAFAEDRDIHASVAAQIFGVAEDAVTSNMRRAAKTVNFGVIYGISAFGLAQRLEMTQGEAEKFIAAYFDGYPMVLAYQDRLLENCRKQGYVSTILGRRRAINGIRKNTSYRQRNQPEREAINMEIQGSAADLIKMAMLQIHRRLKREQRLARMLLQIHDELVFEVPPEEISAVTALVRAEMTQALQDRLQVPLKVDLAIGPNWLDTEEVSEAPGSRWT
jgi:DNA polymerase-1